MAEQNITPLAYRINAAVKVSGSTRTAIYEAIRNRELAAKKYGKGTFIEHAELARWIQSWPSIGHADTAAPA